MPKLACPCGFVHNLSPIPDDGWITVRDRDYDSMVDAELELRNHPNAPDDAVNYHGSLYECPDCGRIMWQKPGNEQFSIFLPNNSA